MPVLDLLKGAISWKYLQESQIWLSGTGAKFEHLQRLGDWNENIIGMEPRQHTCFQRHQVKYMILIGRECLKCFQYFQYCQCCHSFLCFQSFQCCRCCQCFLCFQVSNVSCVSNVANVSVFPATWMQCNCDGLRMSQVCPMCPMFPMRSSEI